MIARKEEDCAVTPLTRILRGLIPCLLAAAPALAAGDEAAVTIVGEGKGPVHIVEKDGTIREISQSQLKVPMTPSALRAPRPKEEPVNGKLLGQPPQPTEEEQQAKAAEEAAAKAKEAAEKARETKEKELQRYADKDYTYGQGSAEKEDTTGLAVKKSKDRHKTTRRTRAERKAAQSPTNVTVGGETRIRYNMKRD
jgi:hypothetical protein